MSVPETNGVESGASSDWTGNYFNYFTEIEDRFRQARGSGLFLLSPLDWALIESWRTAGVPLDAVLRGIDESFEKWRSRKQRRRLVNSLAYCAQAVMGAANRAPSSARRNTSEAEPPFSAEELSRHLNAGAQSLRNGAEPALHEMANALEELAREAAHHLANLEALEQRLCAMEDKIVAVVRTSQTDDNLLVMRQSLETELRPYRGKMTAEQLAMLERRYLDNALFEHARLPRLSLFYLH